MSKCQIAQAAWLITLGAVVIALVHIVRLQRKIAVMKRQQAPDGAQEETR